MTVKMAATPKAVRSIHTTQQLRCVAALHPTAQKLQCYCIALSYERSIRFNLKCDEAAQTGGRW